MQLNNKLYYDSDSRNASVYVTNMRHFYLYDEGQNTLVLSDLIHGPVCADLEENLDGAPQWNAMTMLDTSTMTPSDVLHALTRHFDVAIESITNSTSIALMSGDCQKVFGEGFKMPSIPQDYKIEPVFDPLFLEQVRNTTILPLCGVAGQSLLIPVQTNGDGSTVPENKVQTNYAIPVEFGYASSDVYNVCNGCIVQDPIKGTMTQNLQFSLVPVYDRIDAATSVNDY